MDALRPMMLGRRPPGRAGTRRAVLRYHV